MDYSRARFWYSFIPILGRQMYERKGEEKGDRREKITGEKR
jgi:hypothetical protein